MTYEELFNKMTSQARRKIIQRVFETYEDVGVYLDIEYRIAVSILAQFTYEGISIQATPEGLPHKWITLSPYGNSVAIGDFIRACNSHGKLTRNTRFLLCDTVGLAVSSNKFTSHTLQDQVCYIQKEAVRQIGSWKRSRADAQRILAHGMMWVDSEYKRRKEYGEITDAEAFRRKLDILSEIDPSRKQTTVWQSHASKAAYGIV